MNPLKQLALGAILVALPHLVAAHPGGHGNEEPITQTQASKKAEQVFVSLVQGKRLGPSWQGKQPTNISSRQTPAGTIWVVTYDNPVETDQAKKILYLFLDEFGNFIGGNHSGKL